MKTLKVLLYEDQEKDAKLVMKALKNVLNRMDALQDINVLWTIDAPSEKPDRPEKPGDENEESCRYPCIFEGSDLKRVKNIHIKSNESTSYDGKKKLELWQGNFDLVILDIYNQSGGDKPGEEYLEWLNFAGFNRPVICNSAKDITSKLYGEVPFIYRIKKSQYELDGLVSIFEECINLSLELATNSQQYTCCSNIYGKPPGKIVSDYKDFCMSTNLTTWVRWTSLWINIDGDPNDFNTIKKHINKNLSIEFDISTIDNHELQNIQSQINNNIDLESFFIILNKLSSSYYLQKFRPDVIFIYHQNILKNIIIEKLIKYLDDNCLSYKPIICLLSERAEGITHAINYKMLQHQMVILNIGDLKFFSKWASNIFKSLSNQYVAYQKSKDTLKELLVLNFYKDSIQALLIARARYRIGGKKRYPSIVPWTSESAINTRILRSSFDDMIRKIEENYFDTKKGDK